MHQIHNLTLFYNISYFYLIYTLMWEKDRAIDNYIDFLLHWNLFI
jgi:hypothetical protein